MDLNKKKELVSVSYLQALCAAAGINHGEYAVDDDSVDVTLTKKGEVGTGLFYSPKLDVQLKCTSSDMTENETTFSFPLKLKNYNELIVQNCAAPRILVVLRVPNDLQSWVVVGDNEISLNHCAYWVSLKGLEQTANGTRVTVHLPKENRLTIEELNRLMSKIGSGEEL